MSLERFGRANSGSVIHRSQKPRTLTRRSRITPSRSRACSRARLASLLVWKVPGPPSTRETLTLRRLAAVVDLRTPAAGGKRHHAHAALLRVAAHAIAMEARKRRVRRPQVTDGMPSATIRSTVAMLTPMIAASSARQTYRSGVAPYG